MTRATLSWPDGWRTPAGEGGPAAAEHSPFRTQEWPAESDSIDPPNALDEHATVFRPDLTETLSQTMLAQDSAERMVDALILEARQIRLTLQRGQRQLLYLVVGSWAVAVLVAIIVAAR